MKNKKVVYTIIGIVSVALIALAITYAYWQITKSQEKSNILSSACLDITIADAEDGNTGITLQDQYPLSDEEGAALKPYKFTVTNNCNVEIDYQLALEALGDSEEAMQPTSIKVMLDDAAFKLSDKGEKASTLTDSYIAYHIRFGTLARKGESGSSVTHELRLWISSDAPVSENNKTFRGKITVSVGQGIENLLAKSILAQYGGLENAVETISDSKLDQIIKSNESKWVQTKTTEPIYRDNGTILGYREVTLKQYWGTAYTVDESGNYKLSGTIVQSSLDDCRNGKNNCGKYTMLNTTSATYTAAEIFEITDFRTSGNYVSANTRKYVSSFEVAPNDVVGVFSAEDDYGTSYYLRGNVTNNYVQFGTYTEEIKKYGAFIDYDCWDEGICENNYTFLEAFESTEACEDYLDYEYGLSDNSDEAKCELTTIVEVGSPMYWRIVRINGDGSIRLIYDGITTDGQNNIKNIGSVSFNQYTNGRGRDITKKYAGYMYGTDNDPFGESNNTELINSTIKNVIDTWYEANLKTNYEDYIMDSIFCNDRSIFSSEWGEDDDGDGINDAALNIVFNSAKRLNEGKPTLKCSDQRDRFTANDKTLGNGNLTNPVGLLTADEAMMAGVAKYSSSNNSTYIRGYYWTMTPSDYDGWDPFVYQVSNSSLTGGYMDTSYYDGMEIRPVINLKADVEFTGSGTSTDPYVIVTD